MCELLEMTKSKSSANPIAAYAQQEGIQAKELSERLGISKGAASDIINGKRGVGLRTAIRMERLTGRSWREFITPGPPTERRRAAEALGEL